MTRFLAAGISLMLAASALFAAQAPTLQPATANRADCPTCRADDVQPLIHEPLARVWPVAEPDLLTVFETLAASPWGEREYRARLSESKRRLAAWSDEPAAASTLPKAQRAEVRFLRAPFDFAAAEGLAPLKTVFDGFSRTYLFIDARDRAEFAYATAELERDPALRVVALSGSLAKLRALRPAERFYFDQGGALRRLLRLTTHPSRVELSARGAWVRAVLLDAQGRPAPENDAPVELPEGEIPVPADVRAAAKAAQTYLRAHPTDVNTTTKPPSTELNETHKANPTTEPTPKSRP